MLVYDLSGTSRGMASAFTIAVAVQEEAREMRDSYEITLHKRALSILQRGPEQRAYEMAERMVDVKIARQQKKVRRER